jgi:Tol biopolymer transport system component
MRKLAVSGFLLILAAIAGLTAASASTTPSVTNGQIVFDRLDPSSGNKAVFTANADGSHARMVVRANSVSCCAVFSPDGSKLVVPYPIDDGRIGTSLINANGTGYTPFPIGDPTLNVGCGSWSPNGKRLACESWDNTDPARNGIYTISSADGGDLTRVTNAQGLDDQPGSYSPNGNRLVFGRFDWKGVGLGLFVVNTDGTHLRQITPPGTIIQSGNPGDWSPQGNEIIFSRHLTNGVFGSIWVIHANGSGLHEIHIQGLDCGASFSDPNGVGCHGVRWSPDGKKIIFAAGTAAADVNIYTANVDGTGLTRVTSDGGDDDPAWGTHPPVR